MSKLTKWAAAGKLARSKGWTLEAAELYLLAEKYDWTIDEDYAGQVIVYTGMNIEEDEE